MKNELKKLTLGVLIACALSSMSACRKEKAAHNENKNDNPSFPTMQEQMILDSKKYKGKTIKIWQWQDEKRTPNEVDDAFMKATGAAVEIKYVPYGDEYDQKILASVTSGNGPDIIEVEERHNPTWVKKKILYPISKVRDFRNPQFSKMAPKVKEYWTFNGKTYAYGDAKANSYMLYYNKYLFKSNKLEDPYELWKKGQWKWDKFFELGQKLTQDTNDDGMIDQWGYEAWPVEQWFTSNGVELVTMEKGVPKFGLTGPDAIESLQAMRDLKNISCPGDSGPDPQGHFMNGNLGMNYWGWWELENFRNQFGDKLGFVSFPVGPSFDGKMADIATGTLMRVTTSSDDPEFIGKYIQYVGLPADEEKAVEAAEAARQKDLAFFGSEEMKAYAYEISKNSSQPLYYTGYGKLPSIIDKILWESGDMPPAQVVETWKDEAQAAIDAVWNEK